MKKLLISLSIVACGCLQAQSDKYWVVHKETTNKIVSTDKAVARLSFPKVFDLYDLNTTVLRNTLFSTFKITNKKSVIIYLPNTEGKFEQFEMVEASNFEPTLQTEFSEIRAYSGKGITDKYATVKLSISPQGIQTMVFRFNKENEFIEPYSSDHNVYSVFKSSRSKDELPFSCSTMDKKVMMEVKTQLPNTQKSSGGQLKTLRLALSCNGEYANFYGATIASPLNEAKVLAAFNATLTRCNGVFERDLALHLNLIKNTTKAIFYNTATDPYSNLIETGQTPPPSWNSEVQATLTNTIGSADYDIGHLFAALGGEGSAGCIGCVCEDGKGSAFSAARNGTPQGEIFDIDLVTHEIGHQLGANHTFSFFPEQAGVNKEVASGVTIMSYAGITSGFDVAQNTIDVFHQASIAQIQANLDTKTCSVSTPISTNNATPIVNAGLDFIIPKSTPFMLTGSATDANPGDALTYCWEQNDNGSSQILNNSKAREDKPNGPNWRNWKPTSSPTRIFPTMASIIANSAITNGTGNLIIPVEALSSVERTLNFRLTVRDNAVYSSVAPVKVGQTNFDDTLITVNATAGPFIVRSPNTAIFYSVGSSQNITWDVAGTTSNGVNCANVDIFLSTDGGNTFGTTLLSGTPNDGTQAVTIPNIPGKMNRIMIKGAGHIFFDISNINFTIGTEASDTVAPSIPTNLIASGTTQNSTILSWTLANDNVGVTGYEVYEGITLLGTTALNSVNINALIASTTYNFTVKAKDAAGNVSGLSNMVRVVTLAPLPDTTAPSAPTNLTALGTTTTTTNLSWSASIDDVAVSGYEVYRGTTLLTTVSTTTYSATGLTALTAYSFTIKAKDVAGNISGESNIVNVTTLAATNVAYCASTSSNANSERIGKVVIGTINNISTGTAGYENFTAQSTNVARGTAYTISITPTWSGTISREAFAVWIDYNKDGDFADLGELVFSRTPSTMTPILGRFTIPTTATLGATRVRVSMQRGIIPTACQSFSFGQVEDYTVNIVSTIARQANTSVSNIPPFKLYPVPVKENILNISGLEKESTFKIFNLLGQELTNGKIDNNVVNVSILAAGNYIIEISNVDGSKAQRFIKE